MSAGRSPSDVGLVIVGDELLRGDVQDANRPWLGRRLTEAGLSVSSVLSVPDDPAAIGDAVSWSLERGGTVIVTGGLGATRDDVLPDLRARAPGVARRVVRSLVVVGLSASRVASQLRPVEAEADRVGSVAYLSRPGEVLVRLAVTQTDDAGAVADELVGRARDLLGDTVAAVDEELEPAVIRALRRAGATVGTAESVTGGLLAAALTSVPGASSVVRGGLVTYATDVKADLADVPRDMLARDGPVAASTAEAMARGARLRCGADFGVATTGVAGPDHQDGSPPGTLHVAVSSESGTTAASYSESGLTESGSGPGRDALRRVAVVRALDLLRRRIPPVQPASGESSGPVRR